MATAICATGDAGRWRRIRKTRPRASPDEYSGFTAVDDLKLNGKLTLGENTADNGGARVAYMAMEKRAERQGRHHRRDTRPSSASSWGLRRSGARISRRKRRGNGRSPIRIPRPLPHHRYGGETCRVPESVLVQVPASRWSAPTRAGFGRGKVGQALSPASRFFRSTPPGLAQFRVDVHFRDAAGGGGTTAPSIGFPSTDRSRCCP